MNSPRTPGPVETARPRARADLSDLLPQKGRRRWRRASLLERWRELGGYRSYGDVLAVLVVFGFVMVALLLTDCLAN